MKMETVIHFSLTCLIRDTYNNVLYIIVQAELFENNLIVRTLRRLFVHET